MSNEMINENFDEYMDFFKKQTIEEKRNIIYEQLKMLSGLTNNLCKDNHIPNELIINKELLNVNNKNYTEDDYLNSLIVFINSIQNSICDYTNGISDMLDKINNE